MRPFCSERARIAERVGGRKPGRGRATAFHRRNKPFGAGRGAGPSRQLAVRPPGLARRRTPLATPAADA
jgi:hypothetical protein